MPSRCWSRRAAIRKPLRARFARWRLPFSTSSRSSSRGPPRSNGAFDLGLDGRSVIRDLQERADVPRILRAACVELQEHQARRARYWHRQIAER